MRELNAAWAVLRDPERRAAYDRSVGIRPAEPAVASTGTATTTARAGGTAVRSPATGPPVGVPDLEPEVEGRPTIVRQRRSRWARHGPVIVVAVLLGMVGVVGCLAAVTGEADPTEVETTDRFPVGSCVVLAADRSVTEASCEAPGALRILDREPFPRPCPAGTRALVLLELEHSLCVPGG